ncbi:MAG: hypothetical protein PHH59_14365 [Methylovulum sp.]|uniref:hypothetical protein n=1 Tax=Methylovulum sp. TaxID=1916980 RepID=UPI002619C321|nr:hypothetical protein [Methylovulum sp.]MDD2725189.1 hypothetical protein [Methylovulum sp.]MDD5125452.1 hypothetical protein [Methylovulum sp.]
MAINSSDYKTTDQFLLDSYSGKGGYVTGAYLVKHPREGDDKHQRRIAAAVYPNFVRKIIDVCMGFLWRQPPNREVGGAYAAFMKNADGAGGKLDGVLANYQRLAMILGTVYIIVDRPKSTGASRANQTLPFLALRLKGQLVAESKDSAGVWQSVTFSEAVNGETQFRTFTQTGWKVSQDAEGRTVIDQGEYSLGSVPVVRLHIAKPLNPTDSYSDTWAYDLAVLNWELYNLRSELRDLERSQTFAILAMPCVDDAERERLKDLTIGTDNGLTYNPTGGGKPDYIAPPSEPTAHYMERIKAVVADIYRVANLEFVGGVQQSGVATAFHFQECNSSLRTAAENAETAETEINALVNAWMGHASTTDNISYANDFNLTDLAQAVAVAIDSLSMGMGPEFDRAMKKRTAKVLLGNDVSAQTMAAIDDEIDALGDVYGDRVQQQGGV